MRKYLIIALYVVLFAGLVVCLGFVNRKQTAVLCKSLTINIDHSNDDYFVEEEDIHAMLHRKGDTIIGQRLNEINTGMLEKILRRNPHVEKAEVFSSIDGEVKIDVTQRSPILRIIGAVHDGYYIDKNGVFMPICDKYAARVPIANGYIYEPYTYGSAKLIEKRTREDSIAVDETQPYRYTLKDSLYTLAKYVNDDEFWQALIQQIYVTPQHEFELIPNIGNHRIILGNLDDMEGKFSKLLLFYRKGLSKTGWDKYSIINLKYKNQVVCTKK